MIIYPPYIPPRPIIFHDDGFQLVRPPVFQQCNLQFQSVDQAAGYLQARRNKLTITPPSEASLTLLCYADQEQLLQVLERIKYELLPLGYYTTAERLALEILRPERDSPFSNGG